MVGSELMRVSAPTLTPTNKPYLSKKKFFLMELPMTQ